MSRLGLGGNFCEKLIKLSEQIVLLEKRLKKAKNEEERKKISSGIASARRGFQRIQSQSTPF